MKNTVKHDELVKNEYALNSLIRVDSLNENAVPYITDLLISKVTGFSKKYVDRKIRTHYKRLSKMGKRGNEIPTLEVKSKSGQTMKVYKLNQKQAVFLCNTFDDSEFILDFKSQLASAFIDAITLLKERQLMHESSKPVTKSMHDAIKENPTLNSPYDHTNIEKLVYKTALNKSTNQIRREKGIPKGKKVILFGYLSIDEQLAVSKVKTAVIGLISLNLGYQDIVQSLSVIKDKIIIDKPKKLMLPMVIQ